VHPEFAGFEVGETIVFGSDVSLPGRGA